MSRNYRHVAKPYLPSPGEIAEATAAIRDGWTDEERHNRNWSVTTNGRMLAKTIDTEGVEEAAREAMGRRLADERRGATSLIATLRQFASAEGWTERAESDEEERKIGWPNAAGDDLQEVAQ